VKLYELGWIVKEDAEFVEQGKLDDITKQAIIDFQNHVLALEIAPEDPAAELIGRIVPIDPANIVLDETTLEILFDEGWNLVKPAPAE